MAHATEAFVPLWASEMVLVVLLLASGEMEPLSIAMGLVVVMRLNQIYFHRFIDELPPDHSPEPPIRLVKLISFAIQARPQKAWCEYLILTILLGGSMVALVAQL